MDDVSDITVPCEHVGIPGEMICPSQRGEVPRTKIYADRIQKGIG